MALFTVYCDESGTHTDQDNDILVVAGFIAEDSQWVEFTREWSELLMQEGVQKLHMKEFENRRGEFTEANGWGNERRIKFLQRLIGIIRRRVSSGIGAAVSISAYEKVVAGTVCELLGSRPYAFCVRSCQNQVATIANKFNRIEPVAYVIENGAGHNQAVNQAFLEWFAKDDFRSTFRLGSLRFDSEALPLQAADLWAYEIWKVATNIFLHNEKRPLRKSMQKLKAIPNQILYYGEKELTDASSGFMEAASRFASVGDVEAHSQ